MACAANTAVDIGSWVFYGRGEEEGMPFMLGPIVGAVSEETARVLVEVSEDQEVTMEAFMDDESVCCVAKDVSARTPTAFELDGFESDKRIRVTVTAGGEEREAQFTTSSNKLDWKIATVSCNCHTHTERLGLWERLSRVIGDVDCVLHLGDQIYGDSDFGVKESGEPFESAWHASLTILRPFSQDEWEEHEEEILECYRNTYRTTWNIPHVAKVLASSANYMICDDHEFTDDLGDEPEHCDPDSVEFYVARLAYRVYNEYQRQLLDEVDVTDPSLKSYYAFKLSPRVGFFMTENRVERSLHRHSTLSPKCKELPTWCRSPPHKRSLCSPPSARLAEHLTALRALFEQCLPGRAQASEEDWENRAFLGPAQWDRLTEAFESDFSECDMVLFGTPTPLVFLSQRATWLAQKQIDDARGTWGHSDFKTEQTAITKMLTDWQNGHFNRALVTIGGDVHMGGFTDSWHAESDTPLHQMTASAVGNVPEGNIDKAKEMVIRHAMHADERLFEFEVKHHDWIIGPNFGMVDFHLAKHGRRRPQTTLTLVPHKGSPKIRNLQLGNANVDINNAEHSPASQSAHEYAEIMGAAPAAGVMEAPYV